MKLCVSLTVFSRGWLTWRWDSPIRGLIWQEDWWSALIDWDKFASTSDSTITTGLQITGIVLMLSSVVPWIKSARWLLLPISAILLVDSFARFIDSGSHLGMAIEHTLQWSVPLFLFMSYEKQERAAFFMQIASALCFIGHGLYAAGFHPVPLKYQTMTNSLLGLEGDAAMKFLWIAGVIDFLSAVAIFVAPLRRFALIYMIGWGAATAFARVLTGTSWDPWLMETVVRSSHWMMPLLLLGLDRRRSDQ